MKSRKDIVYGVYSDEAVLLEAVKAAKASGIEIYDVLSPMPIHGLDKLLGLKESRLHIAGFVLGLLGVLIAFLGMTWITVEDWSLIFGGKPYWAVPSFVPITFEVMVLVAAIGMTLLFYTVSRLGFGVKNPVIDERITDDKFCLVFLNDKVKVEESKRFLLENNAEEIIEKSL